MPALGSIILLATFVVASYALAASVAGGRRRSHAIHFDSSSTATDRFGPSSKSRPASWVSMGALVIARGW